MQDQIFFKYFKKNSRSSSPPNKKTLNDLLGYPFKAKTPKKGDISPETLPNITHTNFKTEKGIDEERIRLKQLEIASEWDIIETALHNDEFWLFINKEDNDKETRIELLFELLVGKSTDSEDNYYTFRKFNEKSRQEALWLHLVSAIDFWKKDTSPDFEKTDIFIEKTVDTGFELMDNEPLRKVFDLGKFLWKENFK